MSNPTDAFIASLRAFIPSDDDVANVGRLYEIFEGFEDIPGRNEAMPELFAFMERYPEADLGSPGPLVHELERMGGYEKLLKESLHRQPTHLTLWMINRILNGKPEPDERSAWIAELRMAVHHPLSPSDLKESALDYLAHQGAEI